MKKTDKPDLARRHGPGVAIGLALALVATNGVLRAQNTSLPDAADVIARHVKAFGTRATWDKIRNRITKLRVIHDGMDLEDSVVEYYAKPNKRYLRIESEAFGVIERGCDGKVVWHLSEERGPVVERKGSGADLGQKNSLERLLDWRKHYTKAKCTGTEKVGDRLCHRLVLTPRTGKPETMLFDAKTHLLTWIRTVSTRAGCGLMPTESTLSDYRRVDGIMIPHRVHQVSKACGTERTMTLLTKSIEHNVKMPKDRFELPPKVRLAIAEGRASAGCCEEKANPARGGQGRPGKAPPTSGDNEDNSKNKNKTGNKGA